jgi:hypothetical protein
LTEYAISDVVDYDILPAVAKCPLDILQAAEQPKAAEAALQRTV